jgi:hypothetical protein
MVLIKYCICSKHHMRDMLTSDDENDQDIDDGYPGESSRPTPPSQPTTTSKRTPQLSSADFPAVSSSSKSKEDSNLPALPASASWAKIGTSSTPSTPVLAISDAFGPTLSAAVAASQQKTQFPPMPKRKSEKKKRKEQLQQQKSTPEQTFANIHVEPSPTPSKAESTKSEQTSLSPISSSTTSAAVQQETTQVAPTQSLFEQGLTGFVLGQAYRDLCPLPSEEEFESKQRQADDAEEQLTLGVSALLLDDSEKPQPSPAQRHLEAIQSAASSVLLPVNIPPVLDFLTYSTPTPKYNGRFNPFSHMATLGANQPQQIPNGVLNNNLDSPIRRHSRFGFAQA